MAALTWRSTTLIPARRRCAVWLALIALGLAGCGGDDEEPASTTTGSTATETAQTTATTDTGGGVTRERTETAAPKTSPEAQPGGAGDEEPVHSLARLTGRDGHITPRVVRVPAFISIRVELRSADGRRYSLSFGKRRLSVGGDIASVSSRFAGLRPGAALVGRPVSEGGNAVRIEATAEPGP
jgi:hypothetical protein